ncbi:MAG: TOBE domain-containing protein, partial [Acidimicrobiales bacterium]
LVTHDQDEALSMADQVAVMRAGRVAQAGTPEDLYTWPVDAELAAFLGEANLLPGIGRGTAVETALGTLATRGTCPGSTFAATSVTVLVRPEQIRLRAGADGPGLAARVLECGYHGHDTVIKVKPDDSPVGAITVRAVGDVNLARGSQVRLEAGGEVLAWPDRG